MMSILFVVLAFCLGYAYLLHVSLQSWEKHVPETIQVVLPSDKITVVIAARNEAMTISRCVQSLLEQNNIEALEEIIIVDDHSLDDMNKILQSFGPGVIHYVRLPEGSQGKKAAITLGVSMAKSDIIAVTDADSQPEKDWLLTIQHYFSQSKRLAMVTGLVLPQPVQTTLERFQWLDFAATMTLTKTGIENKWFYLANGANMAFRKSVFDTVNGYRGNETIASGDDVFLMSKIAHLSGRDVAFMQARGSGVNTKAESTWMSLWQQRQRWAQKTKAYAGPGILFVQGLAFILAATWWLSLVLALAGVSYFWKTAIFAGGIKLVSDYLFLHRISHQLGRPEAMKSFIASWFIYQVYIVLAGITALFPGKTTWKNRTVG